MQRGSYISCQSALTFYGLIPDVVPTTISVATRRPHRWITPLGAFEFHHLQPKLLRGYRLTELGNNQSAFVATPEKALLDLVYLQPKGDTLAYLRELRLQNLDGLNINELQRQTKWFSGSKLPRTVINIINLARAESREYINL